MRIRVQYLGASDFESDFVAFAIRHGFDIDEIEDMATALCGGFEWCSSTPEGEWFAAVRIG